MNILRRALLIAVLFGVVAIVFLLLDRGDLALIFGGVGALGTIVYGELERRRDQNQASRHPVLKVADVRLVNAQEVTEVQETIQQRQSWLDTLERYEEEKRLWQERQAQIEEERAQNPLPTSSYDSMENIVGPIDPRQFSPRDPTLIAQRNYDGLIPNKVLHVTVVNKGKVAATDLFGQLYLESAHLCPLEFPGLDGDVDTNVQEGSYKVEVGIDEGLLPAPAEGEHTFRVGVLTQVPGKTSVRCTFTTSQGYPIEGAWPLEVPSQ